MMQPIGNYFLVSKLTNTSKASHFNQYHYEKKN